MLMQYALCQSEYLRVKCDSGEVVIVEHARYGRMSISRCVKQDFGFVGCSVNVLSFLDAHCSGRRACSIRVLDDNFDNVKPCHDDLKSYLEVSYRCVKGINTCFIPTATYACRLHRHRPRTLHCTIRYREVNITVAASCSTLGWPVGLPDLYLGAKHFG